MSKLSSMKKGIPSLKPVDEYDIVELLKVPIKKRNFSLPVPTPTGKNISDVKIIFYSFYYKTDFNSPEQLKDFYWLISEPLYQFICQKATEYIADIAVVSTGIYEPFIVLEYESAEQFQQMSSNSQNHEHMVNKPTLLINLPVLRSYEPTIAFYKLLEVIFAHHPFVIKSQCIEERDWMYKWYVNKYFSEYSQLDEDEVSSLTY